MRLSIEVTAEEHQRLKAVAALQGKSIKSYVLERVLPQAPTPEEAESLRQLEAFLATRIKAAGRRPRAGASVTQLFTAVHRGAK